MDKKEIQKNTYLVKSIFLLLFAGFLIAPGIASAASLYLSPSSGSFSTGQTVTVQVYVSSVDQAMNAASGMLSFPQDKLEVTSLVKTGSIISLWVQEPSYSNITGTINFEGIVLNPGFTGPAGRLISVTFRVKAGGIASTAFATGSILANDGQGTNILTGMSGSEFSLGFGVPTPTPTPAPTTQQPGRVGIPSLPRIVSSTHPNEESWYQSNEPRFSWDLPTGVSVAKLLVGNLPRSTPTISYVPPINSRDLSELNLEDGVWYFHVQLGNAIGYGGTSHFKFQIDSTKPEFFELKEQEREDVTDPIIAFLVDAEDSTSGIDHYEFQFDDNEVEIWQDDGSHLYRSDPLSPGKHLLIAKAVDRAGNNIIISKEIFVEALLTPQITQYPQEVESGDTLRIGGETAYKNTNVVVWLKEKQGEKKSYTALSNEEGAFNLVVSEKLPEGIYTIWAVVSDARGAQSNPSQEVTTIVQQVAFLRLGSDAIKLLSVIIPIVAMILVLGGIFWLGWLKFMEWKIRVRKEIREAEQALHRSIDVLKEDLSVRIKTLEHAKSKRKLTQKEGKVIKELKKNLDDVEKFVKKEIKDIEKEMK